MFGPLKIKLGLSKQSEINVTLSSSKDYPDTYQCAGDFYDKHLLPDYRFFKMQYWTLFAADCIGLVRSG